MKVSSLSNVPQIQLSDADVINHFSCHKCIHQEHKQSWSVLAQGENIWAWTCSIYIGKDGVNKVHHPSDETMNWRAYVQKLECCGAVVKAKALVQIKIVDLTSASTKSSVLKQDLYPYCLVLFSTQEHLPKMAVRA